MYDAREGAAGRNVVPTEREATSRGGSRVLVVDGDGVGARVGHRKVECANRLLRDCQTVPLLDDELVVDPELYAVVVARAVVKVGVKRVDPGKGGRDEARPPDSILLVREELVMHPPRRLVVVVRGRQRVHRSADIFHAHVGEGLGKLAVGALPRPGCRHARKVHRLLAGLGGGAPRRKHGAREARVIKGGGAGVNTS